jgi:hypothetical protein
MKLDFNARTASSISAGASASITACVAAGDALGGGAGDCATAKGLQQTMAAQSIVLSDIEALIL